MLMLRIVLYLITGCPEPVMVFRTASILYFCLMRNCTKRFLCAVQKSFIIFVLDGRFFTSSKGLKQSPAFLQISQSSGNDGYLLLIPISFSLRLQNFSLDARLDRIHNIMKIVHTRGKETHSPFP